MKSFTSREWVFLLIITIIIQAFIWYTAFINAGNGSALNFVSFAGTLISIILAVLAIGYTYGESISEKNKSDNITIQIEKLKDVITSLVKQNASLDQISKINDELLQLSENLNSGMSDTHTKFDNLSQSINGIFEQKNQSTKQEVESKESKTSLIEILPKNSSFSVQIGLLFNLYIAKSKLPANKSISNTDKIFERANSLCKEKNITIGNKALYIGGSATIRSLLQQSNLLKINTDNIMELDKVFEEKIKFLLDELPKTLDSYGAVLYEVFVEEILALE